jgi:uncharacterized protein (DUF1330 family)
MQDPEETMQLRYALALAALSSATVGAAVHTLHAQTKPPVYMIAINEVSNQEAYSKEYLPPAQASIKAHGGAYVAAGPGTVIAGNLPQGRTIVLRWESMEALKAWRDSPEYVAALKIGEKYAKYNIVAVDGVKQ